MALTGTYSRTLDDKNRVAVPKQLREEFGGSSITCLYVAPGTDGSLSLYAPAAFEELAKRLASKSAGQVKVRNYLRLFYARAERVQLDSQGRVRIPDRLAGLANLGRDAILIGVHDHVEIWNGSTWEDFLQDHSQEFDELAGQALE